ncbi:MAG: glycosyltransferase family 39 protein [Planctomycetes bacterium]|nr:glycosyltransferase family 39 protein [Planctomycetota bacterium]
MKHGKLTLIGLALVILTLKIILWFHVSEIDLALFQNPDSQSYLDVAETLKSDGQFSLSPDHLHIPNVTRTPGYPVFILLATLLGSFSSSAVILCQFILQSLMLILIWKISVMLFSQKQAFWACFFYVLDLSSHTSSFLLLTEVLFTAFFLLSLLFALKYLKTQSESRWGALAFLTLAMATLVRPISYYLLFVMLAILIWYELNLQHSVMAAFRRVVLVCLPCILLLGFWQIRNYSVSGSCELSRIVGVNLLYYRAAGVIAQKESIPFEKAQEKLDMGAGKVEARLKPNLNLEKGYKKKAMSILIAEPLFVMKDMLKGAVRLHIGLGEGELLRLLGQSNTDSFLSRISKHGFKKSLSEWWQTRPLFLLMTLAFLLLLYSTYALALLGTFALLRSPDLKTCLIALLLPLCYFVLLSSGPESYARFRVPYMPIVMILAGIGMVWLKGQSHLMKKTSGNNPSYSSHSCTKT